MEGKAAYDCLEGEGTDRLLESTHQNIMKTLVNHRPQTIPVPHFIPAFALGCILIFVLGAARADETCSSPYLARIDGQEEFVYVWTLGVEGMGDGSDKLVTVDVRPGSASYGKIVNSSSVPGRNEAHHGGFTDDRRQLWLAGLDTSRVFVFDVHTDPANPKVIKTIDNFAEATGGAARPHGAYALPGRVLIPCLSNTKDKGGRTGLVDYGNDGNFIATHWLPTKEEARGAVGGNFADGYGYDARVLPRKNALLTSSFTGWNNYTMDFGKLTSDPEAMKHFGQTMVMWDFHARQPKKVFQVPGAPLEIRWAWGDKHNYAFTATALGSKIWLVYADDRGEWQAKGVGPLRGVEGGVVPGDINPKAEGKKFVFGFFCDGQSRGFFFLGVCER